MAGSKTNAFEASVLDLFFGGQSVNIPSGIHVSLFNTMPDDTGGGVEVSGTGYLRVEKVNNLTNWPLAGNGKVKANGTVITFPTAGAGGWSDVLGFGLHTMPLGFGGDMLCWADLTVSKTVDEGDTLEFAVSALTITED